MTHSELITLAAKWLEKKGCALVITDMTHGGPETPDAIGFHPFKSTLIECKASRSDFLADAKKAFRVMPERGMGSYRYYCAPKGMLKPDELPANWGLLECEDKAIRETKKPERFHEWGKDQELCLMLSAMRRIGHNAPKGYSVKCYTLETKNRATIGISADELSIETP